MTLFFIFLLIVAWLQSDIKSFFTDGLLSLEVGTATHQIESRMAEACRLLMKVRPFSLKAVSAAHCPLLQRYRTSYLFARKNIVTYLNNRRPKARRPAAKPSQALHPTRLWPRMLVSPSSLCCCREMSLQMRHPQLVLPQLISSRKTRRATLLLATSFQRMFYFLLYFLSFTLSSSCALFLLVAGGCIVPTRATSLPLPV